MQETSVTEVKAADTAVVCISIPPTVNEWQDQVLRYGGPWFQRRP